MAVSDALPEISRASSSLELAATSQSLKPAPALPPALTALLAVVCSADTQAAPPPPELMAMEPRVMSMVEKFTRAPNINSTGLPLADVLRTPTLMTFAAVPPVTGALAASRAEKNIT
ncbi:MAG: hypothetical protein O2967_03520 [Proteobacteria bacterium]|nr:hypothetical protein [Pseudomonadota bacterium]